MKSKFAFVSDIIFYVVTTFIVLIVLLSYFCPYPYSLIFSAVLTILTVMIIYKWSSKKHGDKRLKKIEKQELEELVNELNFSTRNYRLLVLEKALSKQGLKHERRRGAIVIPEKNAVAFIKFGFDKPTKTDVVKAFNSINKTERAYIISETFEQDIKDFAKRFDGRVLLVDGARLYSYLKEHDSLPETQYSEFLEKKKKGDFRLLLDKRKSKTFFLFGLFFLFMSYFSPIKLYYILFGGAFVIYSIILRAFGKDIKILE